MVMTLKNAFVASTLIAATLLHSTTAGGQTNGDPTVNAQTLGWPYSETYSGDGTYYGFTTHGHCSIYAPVPTMYDGMVPIAINKEQYSNSFMCGACVEGEGTGGGSGHNPIGTFKGYISDECPECQWGDLDFAESGDGRWDITWHFVPCPGGNPTFEFQGSNPWYWKVQPQGTTAPVEDLFVNGNMASKTDDNFFVVQDGVPFYGAQEVTVVTVLGEFHSQMVTLN